MSPHDETLPATDLGRTAWRPGAWFLVLLPVILLAGMVALFLVKGEVLVGKSPVPPDALLKVEFERLYIGDKKAVSNNGIGPAAAPDMVITS